MLYKKRPQLFLLHFAGGSCFSFQFLESFLQDFEVVPLELPGRGRRMRENLLKDFRLAADDLFHQLMGKLSSGPFLLYGHSMGSGLALPVCGLLEKAGRFPACLFMSGNAGPGTEKVRNRHLLGRKELVEELQRLGGAPEQVLQNEELFDFFEPILRADLEIAESGRSATETVVRAPIYAMMGCGEDEVGEISNWARFTQGHFDCEILEGDHFFIYKHPERIAGIIKEHYFRRVKS